MRFIDQEQVAAKARPEAISAAESAFQKLLEERDGEARKKAISSHGAVWAAFKNALAEAGYDKCWYCEAKQVRSDNNVDHFRPKGRVYECPDHPGYWWLAFNYKNFRYACTFCNSYRRNENGQGGGKQDSFPIADESKRVLTPKERVSRETPLLVDPCIYRDVLLLWFDDSGMPELNESAAYLDVNAELKVKVSVRAYHLDHPRLTSERRRIYADVEELCEEGDDILNNEDMRESSTRERYGRILGKLKRRTSPDYHFSSTAICALKGYRARSATARAALELG